MIYPSFTDAQQKLEVKFKRAPKVQPLRWQGVDVSEKPAARMVELLHEEVKVQVATEDLDHWRKDIDPYLPWADNHFEERVCGYPINPGTEWKNWPGSQVTSDHLDIDGKMFNHNYMERYWPRHAGGTSPTVDAADWRAVNHSRADNRGLRYRYGDLNDLVESLRWDPLSRQAYLPMFFPEDTGIANPGRKPCSLGYHFIQRHGFLHCTYYLRSCDFYRHYRDDMYMTIRLQLWILNQLRGTCPEWDKVKPGWFIAHITSLHMFENDLRATS